MNLSHSHATIVGMDPTVELEPRQSSAKSRENQPVVASFASLGETLTGIFTAISATIQRLEDLAERWRRQDEDTVQNVNALFDELPVMFKAVAAALAEANSDIEDTIARAAALGNSGRTVSLWMTPKEVKAFCDLSTSAEMDQYMLDWYEAHDKDLSDVEFRLLGREEIKDFKVALAQCFAAYRRDEYAMTVPCLVSALECAMRSLAPPKTYVTTDMKRLIRDIHQKLQTQYAGSIIVSIWASVLAFVSWFYQPYDPARSATDQLSRHGLQHGTQPPPNERVEVLRLFHALDMITGLYHPTETAVHSGRAVTWSGC